MEKTYDSSEAIVGSVFFVGAGIYIMLTPLACYVIKKSNSYKILMFGGGIVTGIGSIVMGPNKVLTGLP